MNITQASYIGRGSCITSGTTANETMADVPMSPMAAAWNEQDKALMRLNDVAGLLISRLDVVTREPDTKQAPGVASGSMSGHAGVAGNAGAAVRTARSVANDIFAVINRLEDVLNRLDI